MSGLVRRTSWAAIVLATGLDFRYVSQKTDPLFRGALHKLVMGFR